MNFNQHYPSSLQGILCHHHENCKCNILISLPVMSRNRRMVIQLSREVSMPDNYFLQKMSSNDRHYLSGFLIYCDL